MNKFEFQIAAIREAACSPSADDNLSSIEHFNLDELAYFADNKHIAVDYYNNLCKLGLDGHLGKNAKLLLIVKRSEANSREQQLLTQLEHLTEKLSSADIDFVLLKGAALIANGYFDHPGQRRVSDIDFLVHKKDLDSVYDVLCSADYKCALNLAPPLSEYWNSKHLPPFHSESKKFRLECHHEPFESTIRYKAPFTTEQVFKKAEVISFRHQTLKVPCPEHLLLSSFYHSEIDDVNGFVAFSNYRAYLDVSSITQRRGKAMDWSYISTKTHKNNYRKYFYRFLSNVQEKFDSSVENLPVYPNHPVNIGTQIRDYVPRNVRRVTASIIVHSREILKALSKNGQNERQHIYRHNPENWKFLPIYRQLISPSILKKRIVYLISRGE